VATLQQLAYEASDEAAEARPRGDGAPTIDRSQLVEWRSVMHIGREQHVLGALEPMCQPPRVVVLRSCVTTRAPAFARGAFGRVTHDRDDVLVCAEQWRNGVTPDASRGPENNHSTH
jgi:hypothetical protein